MKNKFSIILFVMAFLSGFWFACDKIDEPLTLTEHTEYPVINEDTNDVFFTDSVMITEKQVLLEDFTGHRCVNCPEAAFLAHEMALEYDHKLIIYAVHVGQLAEPLPGTIFSTDFRNETGTNLYNDFNLSSLGVPIGLINRQEFSGFLPLPSFIWEQAVSNEFDKPVQAKMKLKTKYFPEEGIVVVSTESEFTETLEGNYKLVVYLAEDSINAPQLNNNPEIGPDTLYNYYHRNVLRKALNTTYGEFLTPSGQVEPGIVYKKDYTFLPDQNWQLKNCRIIAYIGKQDEVFNLTEIVQVAEVGIKTN